MKYEHKPVLLKQVIEYLAPKKNGRYFDGTLGGGGYAEAILTASSPDGIVIGVDVDEEAISAAKEGLKNFSGRIRIEAKSYADIGQVEKDGTFDGIVLDLGISSYQVDEGARGFSFSKPAPLDMRMDKRATLTAFDIVNNYSEEELEELFKNFGEERFAGRIARNIINTRQNGKINSTAELESICWKSYPAGLRHGRIHPATRVFQALRIEVNNELGNLERFLKAAPPLLKEDGRLVIVSYHSLEDRIVKNAFRNLAGEKKFRILTKKPIIPSDEEISINPRSRSAKLRAIVRG